MNVLIVLALRCIYWGAICPLRFANRMTTLPPAKYINCIVSNFQFSFVIFLVVFNSLGNSANFPFLSLLLVCLSCEWLLCLYWYLLYIASSCGTVNNRQSWRSLRHLNYKLALTINQWVFEETWRSLAAFGLVGNRWNNNNPKIATTPHYPSVRHADLTQIHSRMISINLFILIKIITSYLTKLTWLKWPWRR